MTADRLAEIKARVADAQTHSVRNDPLFSDLQYVLGEIERLVTDNDAGCMTNTTLNRTVERLQRELKQAQTELSMDRHYGAEELREERDRLRTALDAMRKERDQYFHLYNREWRANTEFVMQPASLAGGVPADETSTVRRLEHGKDCPKMPHIGLGYLHDANDDRPYDVDNVTYCGRCHGWMGTAVETTTLRQDIELLRTIACEHSHNPLTCPQCHPEETSGVKTGYMGDINGPGCDPDTG